MTDKYIAALTKDSHDQPGFINVYKKPHGEVEISIREDGDMDKYCSITLTGDEFKQFIGEIILTGLK